MNMKHYLQIFFLLIACVISGGAQSGMLIEVQDPRYFERQQEVIFPRAEVKLVTFEFEAMGEDERGKQRAKQLHDQFLSKIHDLHGGAIITYVTPPGQRIENYRIKAEEIAKQQKAQMALWGRIFVDASGTSLINARLTLVDPPPGVSAGYMREAISANGAPVEVRGVIDAPVTQLRVDFSTMENDVEPLALFLSGLARYYKGATREGTQSARWLKGSIEDLSAYIKGVSEKTDRATLAQAHLYIARANLRLADAEPSRAVALRNSAQEHGAKAAELNPYDAGIPTVQAVIAANLQASTDLIRAYLTKAVSLAPADSNARVNLAVLESAEGRFSEAVRQLDSADFVQRVQKKAPLKSVEELRKSLAPHLK